MSRFGTGDRVAGNFGNYELRQHFAGVAVSAIADASIWLRHINPAGGMGVAFEPSYGDSCSNQFVCNTTSTGFEFFDLSSELNAGKTLVKFSVFGNSGAGTETARCPDSDRNRHHTRICDMGIQDIRLWRRSLCDASSA